MCLPHISHLLFVQIFVTRVRKFSVILLVALRVSATHAFRHFNIVARWRLMVFICKGKVVLNSI
jgi:hypothetical protein